MGVAQARTFAQPILTPLQEATDTNKIFLPMVNFTEKDWPMAAANPQRTSRTPEEVTGNLHVEWYRPIEAYIPQNVQIIASQGLLFLSTSKGLYVLNAATGELTWRFDTELPLGNSPTVHEGVVYVGGHDRKIHALNALTGQHLWEFAEAQAGFDTNPLVVAGKVIAGNRDGYMYAIGAHRTPNQGQLVWKYKTDGAIHISAAYKDGKVFFASNDNHAYALDASTGALIWKSTKLPGDGFHSYWPVIYRDTVIFSGSSGYRGDQDPGTLSVEVAGNGGYSNIFDMLRDSVWPAEPDGSLIGQNVPGQTWANSYPVLNASRITEFFEANPNPDPYKHKPWRRVAIVLNLNTGSEFTFDSDRDGYPEYTPVTMWGTHSGNRYPPVVGANDILYLGNIYQKTYIPQGRVMGWNLDTPSYLSVLPGQGAIDEPNAISMGGNVIYRSICCDRVGDWFTITTPTRSGLLWSYHIPLTMLAPGYDEFWTALPESSRLRGWYSAAVNSLNGIYHNHGDQNPIIPYKGRLYIHRSNAIIAFGTGVNRGKLATVGINPVQDNITPPPVEELKLRLEDQIQRILAAGLLRPGYYNGSSSGFNELTTYFENPGDTLYTLALAYPHLSPQLKTATEAYLRNIFQIYFDPIMYSSIGWSDGTGRESMPLPPEVEADLINYPASQMASSRWTWSYPQHNFYAMWKYAQIFPADAGRAYELAKSKLQVPVSNIASNDYLIYKPWHMNGYIVGYIGFLKLQELAGMQITDNQLRTTVTNELNRLLQLKYSSFDKDTPYEDFYQRYNLNIARNFIILVPELGDYLNQNILAKVAQAIEEYEMVAPYWFVSRYEAVIDEGVMSQLHNNHALFQAKAYILKQSRAELSNYLDVPSFYRGDLFYIQNLVAAIQAP